MKKVTRRAFSGALVSASYGRRRNYFPEWLPALFERTIGIDDWKGDT